MLAAYFESEKPGFGLLDVETYGMNFEDDPQFLQGRGDGVYVPPTAFDVWVEMGSNFHKMESRP